MSTEPFVVRAAAVVLAGSITVVRLACRAWFLLLRLAPYVGLTALVIVADTSVGFRPIGMIAVSLVITLLFTSSAIQLSRGISERYALVAERCDSACQDEAQHEWHLAIAMVPPPIPVGRQTFGRGGRVLLAIPPETENAPPPIPSTSDTLMKTREATPVSPPPGQEHPMYPPRPAAQIVEQSTNHSPPSHEPSPRAPLAPITSITNTPQMLSPPRRVLSLRSAPSTPKTYPRPPETFPELASLTGLPSVREHLTTLLARIEVERWRSSRFMPTLSHLVFTGNPGTGKTTVARTLGAILLRMGILAKGHVVEVSRAQLVAPHIGNTAPLVDRRVDEAMGGVLFIDEAYSLCPTGDRDFGHEAIAQLLLRLENDRGKFLCIIAGYPGPMNDLFACNPGLSSRFSTTIHFPDYQVGDLISIFLGMVNVRGLTMEEGFEPILSQAVSALISRPGFANARSIRQFFEDVLNRQAVRLLAGPRPDSSREQERLARLVLGIDIEHLAARGQPTRPNSNSG